MQHDWSATLTISCDVVEIETFGQIEIALDCGKLPRAPNGILYVNINLRAIKQRRPLSLRSPFRVDLTLEEHRLLRSKFRPIHIFV